MAKLNPAKLHVRLLEGVTPLEPIYPRKYTLTHSDRTGNLYLTIAREYAWQQTQGLYTRLMRDEILASWEQTGDALELHLNCHVNGGLVVGTARRRNRAMIRDLPLMLESLRYGDSMLVDLHPELDEAPVFVHFHSNTDRYRRVEPYSCFGDYRIK